MDHDYATHNRRRRWRHRAKCETDDGNPVRQTAGAGDLRTRPRKNSNRPNVLTTQSKFNRQYHILYTMLYEIQSKITDDPRGGDKRIA
jgi:DeoR/GlpR family transcriptional regulator of sugar metabolism